jgi:hypothetical protein
VWTRQVAFRLGHTGTRMIEKHYARLIESMDQEIARALGDADQMRTNTAHQGRRSSPRTS